MFPSWLPSSSPVVYYHYTTQTGLAAILNSGTISLTFPHPNTPGVVGGKSTRGGDVFLTRMDPSNSMEAVARNNYR